jgi:hypothetical protein
MDKNCNREDKSCGDNCTQTRKEVGKIMAVFGLIIAALGYYIISNGILEQAFR